MLLRFVHDAATLERDAAVTPEIVAGLQELVPTADFVQYTELDWGRRRVPYIADGDHIAVDGAGNGAYWQLHQQHPVCDYFARTGDFRPRKISDLTRPREWRACELYNTDFEVFQHELDVRIPAQAAYTKTFRFCSSRRDFSERDRLMLELLRPHLHLIDETFEHERRVTVDAQLTRREREILGWVECGKTNDEIAKILWISPLTVRKHLENIYEKLGVRTRTAAVACLRKDAAARR